MSEPMIHGRECAVAFGCPCTCDLANRRMAGLESQLLAAQVAIQRLREITSRLIEAAEDTWASGRPVAHLDYRIDNTKEAIATPPDISLLEAHDAQVKREGAREALERLKSWLLTRYVPLSPATVACSIDKMIAALDQPTQGETP